MKRLLMIITTMMLLMSCREMMNHISDSDGESGYLDDLFGPDDPPSLKAPGEFLASRAGYPDKVLLQWDRVDGADFYELEKAPEETGPFTDMGVKIYGSTYEDTTVESGERAWYRLRAYSRSMDLYSPYTEEACGFLLSTPSGVKASKGVSTQHIILNWDAVPGASGYDIYRSTGSVAPNNPYRSVSGIETSSVISVVEAEQGVEYYFWVRSRNSRGANSAFSSYSMGFALPEGAPPRPENLTAEQGVNTDSISLSWTGPGADFYYVYRWSDYNSQEENITPEGLPGTTYTDSDTDALQIGARYYYAIQGVKRDEVDAEKLYKGAFSETGEGYLLSPPMDLGSRWRGSGVDLTWSGVPGAFSPGETALHNGWSYRIEYGSSASGPFSALTTVSVTETNAEGKVTYRHEGASAPIYYRVVTLNGGGTESVPSAVDEPVTGAVGSLKAGENSKPLGGETANSAGVFPVHLSWTEPAGAVRYRVERATKENGKFAPLGETADPVYTDGSSALQPGIHYYYRVIPLNSLGKDGDVSVKVPGYGALTDAVFLTEYNENAVLTSQKKLTLMHKGGLDALGSETKNGSISGSVAYSASGGLSGAEVTMKYTNYCDVADDRGAPYYVIAGNSDTIITSVTSQNGHMRGTMNVTGMYPGKVHYDGIKIYGGAAGGGTYGVEQSGRSRTELDWTLLR